MRFYYLFTSVAGVVDQDYFLKYGRGRPINHAVHRPQKRGPGLIVKNNYDGGFRQSFHRLVSCRAAVKREKRILHLSKRFAV